MQYTTLGKRTGLKVSVLGFGAMRLPMKGQSVDRDKAVPMIHRAFELGITYIDSAVFYCNADSQAAVGEALKGWRDKVVVSTKNHSYGRKDYATFRKNLEDSLRKLDVERIDLYNLHGLNWKSFQENVDGPDGSYQWMAKAKDEGLIKHICFSFHDNAEALENLAKTGLFDVVTCQYNLLDRSLEPALKVCHAQGMGVVVMGPVGGGRLGAPSEALQRLIPGSESVPEVALRFVLANPSVSVALSGMSTIEHVEENARVAARKTALTPKEKAHVSRVLNQYKKLAELYCTGCNYCMPCPVGVDIPWMFATLNNERVYNLTDLAHKDYRRSTNSARMCIACGKCMEKCPQHIDIIHQLRETVRTLDQAYGKLTVEVLPGTLQAYEPDGARAKIELRGTLRYANLSDHPAEPVATFSPARGVEVLPGKKVGTLQPFEQKRVPVTIRAAVKPGKPIETGLVVRSALEPVLGPTHLAIAVAVPGGEEALSDGPAVALDRDEPKVKVTDADAKAHAAKFAVAYDRQALYVRATLKDDLAYPPQPNRPMHTADRIELDFDTTGLSRSQGSRPPVFQWKLVVSPPSADRGECYKWMARPWDRNADGIEVTPKVTKTGVTLTVRIPWEKLDCPAARAGTSFALRFAHISHNARGKVQIHRTWVPEGGYVLLAPLGDD